MAQLGSFMSLFRGRVGDTDGKFFSDDELIEAVNRCLEDMSDESRHVRKTATIHAAEGVAIYKMPSDCIEMASLPMWNGEPLPKFDILKAQAILGADWEGREGTPTAYMRDTVGEDYIRIWRRPMRSYASVFATAEFTPDYIPVTVADDTTTDVLTGNSVYGGGMNGASSTLPAWFTTTFTTPGRSAYLIIWDQDYESPYQDPNYEIVLASACADSAGHDTFTVTRGQLGTTAYDWAAVDCWATFLDNEAAEDDGTTPWNSLTFTYIANATSVSGPTDELIIPFRANRALMHRVCADYFEKEGPRRNMDMVRYHLMRYEEEMRNVIGRQAREFDRLPTYTSQSLSEYL